MKGNDWTRAMEEALPEKPGFDPEEIARDCGLDMELIIYRRESMYKTPAFEGMLITPEDRERDRNRPRGWGAMCMCTACDSEFAAGYASGTSYDGENFSTGIYQIIGEDGQPYSGYAERDTVEAVAFEEGETVTCPICLADGELIRSKRLSKGRTYAMTVVTLEEINGAAVLIWWLMRKHFEQYGWAGLEVRPREAIAVAPGGKLVRFTHTKYSECGESPEKEWRRAQLNDRELIPFYSAEDGRPGRHTIGTYYIGDRLPDLEGTTGEKTGLVEYLSCGGIYAFKYLDIWTKHRNIENLVKAGPRWAKLVKEDIKEQLDRDITYNMRPLHLTLDWIDWSKMRPHEMLGLSREEFRSEDHFWTLQEIMAFYEARQYAEVTGERFLEYEKMFGIHDTLKLLMMDLKRTGFSTADKLARYLAKQQYISQETKVTTYEDYLDMMYRLRPERVTVEMLRPPHLAEAHDRMMQTAKMCRDEFKGEFAELKIRYKPLEWSDGELCIVVPASNQDLIREGAVLDHCVGSYGKKHTSGRPVFFVRHARRPERSWYTLNEDMTVFPPRRIQLHGYKNEWYKTRQGYGGHIPRKVLDFVERWEREVLLPWTAEERKKAKAAAVEAGAAGETKKEVNAA